MISSKFNPETKYITLKYFEILLYIHGYSFIVEMINELMLHTKYA